MPNARFACLATAALAGTATLLAIEGEFASGFSTRGLWLRTAWPDPAAWVLVAFSAALAVAAVVAAITLGLVAGGELLRLSRKFELLALSGDEPRPRLQASFAPSLLASDGVALLNGVAPTPERSIDQALAARSFRALSLLLLGAAIAVSLQRLAYAGAGVPEVARLLLPPVVTLLVTAAALLLGRWLLLPMANDVLSAAGAALAWGNSERAIARAEDHPAPLVEAIERLRSDIRGWREAAETRKPDTAAMLHPAPLVEAIERLRGDLHDWREAAEARTPHSTSIDAPAPLVEAIEGLRSDIRGWRETAETRTPHTTSIDNPAPLVEAIERLRSDIRDWRETAATRTPHTTSIDDPAPLVEAIERLRGDIRDWRETAETHTPDTAAIVASLRATIPEPVAVDVEALAHAVAAADREHVRHLDAVLQEVQAAAVQQREAARSLHERLDTMATTGQPRDTRLQTALSNLLADLHKLDRTGTNG
jgi:hypothetical protein